jgi:hypothetical protein
MRRRLPRHLFVNHHHAGIMTFDPKQFQSRLYASLALILAKDIKRCNWSHDSCREAGSYARRRESYLTVCA